MATIEDSNRSSLLPKACENCRLRKIRCNKANPCSNCTSSGITCRPSARQVEHRPRMIVSNNYERQIEQIHERLAGIELALRNFSVSQTTSTPTSHVSQAPNQHTLTVARGRFEGDSSFRSQTVRASEVAGSLNTSNDGDLSIAIDTLEKVVHAKDVALTSIDDMHFVPAGDRSHSPHMDLLPAEFVIKLLGRIKEKYPVCFLNYSVPNDGYLDRLCQRTYFPIEPMSLGELTSMYGMLYYVIQEYIQFTDPITNEYDCVQYLDVCKKNFHNGIETYDLMVEASFDNAFALMLAASKALDDGKVALAWSLASATARHLQSLGYHRESTFQNDLPDVADRKRHLFWLVYGIEKNVSLNLGRASSFNDWDIDVKLFTLSSDPAIRPWQSGTINFIELSRLQGQVYEKLYSVSASRRTRIERSQAVEELSQSLGLIHHKLRNVDHTPADYKDYYELFTEASDVIYYSLTTLIHRGASHPDNGTEISSSCFEAAKMCLKSHLNYFPLFTSQGEPLTMSYVNWILLYCSFTPFIVVFLHAIASKNLEDVKLLQDMTNSLEPVNTYSTVLNRVYTVCRVFSRVAEVIVSKQHGPQQDTGSGVGSYNQQTDSLLFHGFNAHHAFDQQLPNIFVQGDLVDPNMEDISSYFGNWVSSNQPAMDLFSMDFGGNM